MKPTLCLGYAPKMPVPPLHLHARLLHGRGRGWPGDPKNWLINLWIQRISLASQPSIFTQLNLSTPFDKSLINCVNFLSKMLPGPAMPRTNQCPACQGSGSGARHCCATGPTLPWKAWIPIYVVRNVVLVSNARNTRTTKNLRNFKQDLLNRPLPRWARKSFKIDRFTRMRGPILSFGGEGVCSKGPVQNFLEKNLQASSNHMKSLE